MLMQHTGVSSGATSHKSPTLPSPVTATKRVRIDQPDGSNALLEPIRSEDSQVLGFTYIEVDAPVFAADWAAPTSPR